MLNQALIFIKPQAFRPKAVELIREILKEKGIEVENSGILSSMEIKKRNIIDRHYFAMSRSAVAVSGRDFEFSSGEEQIFKDTFGKSLGEVRRQGLLLNALEAMEYLGEVTFSGLNSLWRSGKNTKLASGLYVSRIDSPELYILNGFYPAMKELFTAPGLEVMWFDSFFDPEVLSWYDFRHALIGSTDPKQAAEGSLRRVLLDNWKDLGLDESPSVGKNGIHASAGPVEGLRERIVWLNADPQTEELGNLLAGFGFTGTDLQQLLENETVSFRQRTGPVFDMTEDMDAREFLSTRLTRA